MCLHLVSDDTHYKLVYEYLPLSHEPAKVGLTRVSYPGVILVLVHMVAIIIASSHMLQKCSSCHTDFGRLVFRCSGSAMAVQKVRCWATGTIKRLSRLHLQFTVTQEERQTFYYYLLCRTSVAWL